MRISKICSTAPSKLIIMRPGRPTRVVDLHKESPVDKNMTHLGTAELGGVNSSSICETQLGSESHICRMEKPAIAILDQPLTGAGDSHGGSLICKHHISRSGSVSSGSSGDPLIAESNHADSVAGCSCINEEGNFSTVHSYESSCKNVCQKCSVSCADSNPGAPNTCQSESKHSSFLLAPDTFHNNLSPSLPTEADCIQRRQTSASDIPACAFDSASMPTSHCAEVTGMPDSQCAAMTGIPGSQCAEMTVDISSGSSSVVSCSVLSSLQEMD